jgi:hypothetical protein
MASQEEARTANARGKHSVHHHAQARGPSHAPASHPATRCQEPKQAKTRLESQSLVMAMLWHSESQCSWVAGARLKFPLALPMVCTCFVKSIGPSKGEAHLSNMGKGVRVAVYQPNGVYQLLCAIPPSKSH